MAKNVNLGSLVRDRITGFEGVAIGRHEYLTGCNKVTVQPQGLTKEGKVKESQWFDEQGLLVVTPASEMASFVDKPDGRTGGPEREPRRSL